MAHTYEHRSFMIFNVSELNKIDFDNDPVIEAGKLCGLSIQVDTDIVGSNHDWYITSVWKVEVTI